MKLEQQVCSLELAKKLKELGVKQESLFYWDNKVNPAYEVGGTEIGKVSFSGHIKQSQDEIESGNRYYSAFTVAELGELLPEKVVFRNYQKRSNNAWRINFGDMEFGADTEANTKAKMVVYLLENNLIQND